jgi:xanthine dehydrogenase accessory factor
VSLDLPALRAAVEARGAVVRILVVAVAGSVPREAGTSMLVWEGGEEGTIGGGELENQAVREARGMLGRAGAGRSCGRAAGPGAGDSAAAAR